MRSAQTMSALRLAIIAIWIVVSFAAPSIVASVR
jgi:hypothetical protein